MPRKIQLVHTPAPEAVPRLRAALGEALELSKTQKIFPRWWYHSLYHGVGGHRLLYPGTGLRALAQSITSTGWPWHAESVEQYQVGSLNWKQRDHTRECSPCTARDGDIFAGLPGKTVNEKTSAFADMYDQSGRRYTLLMYTSELPRAIYVANAGVDAEESHRLEWGYKDLGAVVLGLMAGTSHGDFVREYVETNSKVTTIRGTQRTAEPGVSFDEVNGVHYLVGTKNLEVADAEIFGVARHSSRYFPQPFLLRLVHKLPHAGMVLSPVMLLTALRYALERTPAECPTVLDHNLLLPAAVRGVQAHFNLLVDRFPWLDDVRSAVLHLPPHKGVRRVPQAVHRALLRDGVYDRLERSPAYTWGANLDGLQQALEVIGVLRVFELWSGTAYITNPGRWSY